MPQGVKVQRYSGGPGPMAGHGTGRARLYLTKVQAQKKCSRPSLAGFNLFGQNVLIGCRIKVVSTSFGPVPPYISAGSRRLTSTLSLARCRISFALPSTEKRKGGGNKSSNTASMSRRKATFYQSTHAAHSGHRTWWKAKSSR
jgi:hypothetical protein